MSTQSKLREVKLLIPEDLYSLLDEQAKKEGYSNISEYIVVHLPSIVKPDRKPPEELDKLKTKLERYLQDELNKRLTILESIRSQVTELYEKVDELTQRIENIESSVKEASVKKPQPTKSYKTGIERLKEEKIVLESELPPRIQRDRLFSYFERSGAVVLKLSKERIAVDPEYWNEFKSNLLNAVSSNREEDIKRALGDKGYKLWKVLHEDNLVIFDFKTKKWKLVQEVSK